MIAKIDYEAVLTLPDEIVEKFDLRAGDTVHFKERDDGGFELTFPKMETMELDLPEDKLMELMLLAHKKDVTLNKLVEDILRDEVNKIPYKVSVARLEKDFDDIMDNIELGATYHVYEDEEYTKALVAIIPYGTYRELIA